MWKRINENSFKATKKYPNREKKQGYKHQNIKEHIRMTNKYMKNVFQFISNLRDAN